MVMQALRQGAKGGLSKFILFGFMTMAVGGLVMMDVGGFFRGGVSGNAVANVAGEDVPVQEFDRTVRVTLASIGMSPQEAYRLGHVGQILNGEIRGRLLNEAAGDLGIVLGRPYMARKLSEIIAPVTQPGEPPAEALQRILRNMGTTERVLVGNISRETVNGILGRALEGGMGATSVPMARDLYRFQKEKRDIEYIAFLEKDMNDLAAPEDTQLLALYESTKEAYAKPETREIRLVRVKDENLRKTLEITDESLRAAYDSNIDLYTVNATRTLEQAMLDTGEQARKAFDAVSAGKSLKAAVSEAGASNAAYLGSKDFEDKSLPEDIRNQVLAATKAGEIIGPVETPLGWYVIRVAKINEAKTRPFEDVKKEIREEMIENQLIDQYYELANAVDDLLAGGSSLEDVAKEVDIEIISLPAMNQFGQGADGKDALKDHEQVRQNVLQTAFEITEGETSAVFETTDGRFMAVNVEKVNPKSYRAFEDVKKDMTQRWMNDQRRVTAQVKAMQAMGEAQAGQPLSEVAKQNGKTLQSLKGVSGTQEPRPPLAPASLQAIFEANIGDTISIPVEGGAAVARVTGYEWPKEVDENGADFKALLANLEKASVNEYMALYINDKQEQYGARINQRLLDQVYGTETTPIE